MHRRGFLELLLALVAGPNRAAAMYGDLLELRSEHGTVWFWGAYLSTLARCGWKIPVALLAGVVLRELIFDLFHLYIDATPASWRAPDAVFLLGHTGPLLAVIMSTLWFVLPYSAVIYGSRDQVVRLTFAVSVGTTIAFLFVPWLSFIAASLTAVLTWGALTSSNWRGAAVTLLTILASGLLIIGATAAGSTFVGQHNLVAASTLALLRNLGFESGLVLLAVVCSWLHHRLGNGTEIKFI